MAGNETPSATSYMILGTIQQALPKEIIHKVNYHHY